MKTIVWTRCWHFWCRSFVWISKFCDSLDFNRSGSKEFGLGLRLPFCNGFDDRFFNLDLNLTALHLDDLYIDQCIPFLPLHGRWFGFEFIFHSIQCICGLLVAMHKWFNKEDFEQRICSLFQTQEGTMSMHPTLISSLHLPDQDAEGTLKDCKK